MLYKIETDNGGWQVNEVKFNSLRVSDVRYSYVRDEILNDDDVVEYG